MKKTIIATVLAFASVAAFAGGPTVNLTNVGNINNSVSTSAGSNGGTIGVPSTSYSQATGVASAVSNGSAAFNTAAPAAGGLGATITLNGATTTSNTGTAFNVSTGNGTGSAGTSGSANAGLDMAGSYANSGDIGNGYGSQQTLNVAGSIGTGLDGGNGTGSQGSSIGVNITTNGGAAADASTAGNVYVTGNVGAYTTENDGTTGVNVVGSVSDSKTSVSEASTTTTLDVTMNGAPVVLTGGATSNANANNSVNASGSFDDPAVSQ